MTNLTVFFGIRLKVSLVFLLKLCRKIGIPEEEIERVRDNVPELASLVETYEEHDFYYYCNDKNIVYQVSQKKEKGIKGIVLIIGSLLSMDDLFHGDEEIIDIGFSDIEECLEDLQSLLEKYDLEEKYNAERDGTLYVLVN